MEETEAGFFESRGFPYKMTNMGMMLSSIATSGEQNAVVVQTPKSFYVGYYGEDETAEVIARTRRVRKYKVIDVVSVGVRR